MFFALSKTLGFFALPSNIVVLLIVIGTVLLYTRARRAGRLVVTIGIVALLVIGATPFGLMLIAPLEQRFPPWNAAGPAPAGFIVLGGSLSPVLSRVHGQPVISDSADRLTAVADLARRFPGARIVFSGGNGNLFGGASEADYVLPLFESFGVARDRIVIERESRNTMENAVFSKALVDPKPGERWVVITSGFHMPRAVGVFRKAGWPVEADPVDWKVGEQPWFAPFSSLLAGVRYTDTAVREWVGLFVYWLTGRSSALFPAPG